MDRLLQLLSTNSGFTTAEIATMLGEPEDYIKAQIVVTDKDLINKVGENGSLRFGWLHAGGGTGGFAF